MRSDVTIMTGAGPWGGVDGVSSRTSLDGTAGVDTPGMGAGFAPANSALAMAAEVRCDGRVTAEHRGSGGGGGGCASRLRSLETCSTIGFNLAACSDVVSGRCGVESRRTDLPVAGFWYTRMPSLSSSPTATYP
mmetsp:Transcript_18350/g.55625  ORF Transcript_18350/g.55625 Transcript_18350/m.55625 type:complete len:134 (-) Transcript_18350:87-488(-)